MGPSETEAEKTMWLAFKRVAPFGFLAAVPLALIVLGSVAAVHHHDVGVDFRGELYPEAKLVVHGTNPFPPPGADLSSGVNRIFPIPAAILVAPLTLLPVGAAAAVFCVLLLVALAGAIRLLGVTDWRVYGLVALWPPAIHAVQTGNVTILLTLLVAVAWRFRERRLVPGVAIGVAIALKLFLWPLVLWLVARRRYASAGTAAAIAIGGMLLVAPFTSLTAYWRLLGDLGDVFGPHSYNLTGLLVQTGVAGSGAAQFLADAAGIGVLALAYRRRSLTLAIAASLVLSPIVWLHYFVLLVVPLALARPRLSALWFAPLALWVCPGTAGQVRAWHIAIGLAVLAVVTVLAERRAGANETRPVSPPEPARTVPACP